MARFIGTNEKTGNVFENAKPENQTPTQLALENSQPATKITQFQMHSGVLYDTSLEHTLTTLKTANNLFKIEERRNGDNFWNGVPVEKLVDSRLQI